MGLLDINRLPDYHVFEMSKIYRITRGTSLSKTLDEIQRFLNDLSRRAGMDPFLEIAKGNTPGHAAFNQFGRNPDIDTASGIEDVWGGGGVYTGFPTGSAETLEIFSSSANDTSAGTGARTVSIRNLLDGDGNQLPDVTVSLNGTTPVSLGAQTYYRATLMIVLSAGSTGTNEGNLTLRHTITTVNIFAVMPVGLNQTAIGAFTIPVGKTLFLDRIKIQMARSGGLAGSAITSFKCRPFGNVFQTTLHPDITDSQSFVFENDGFLEFPARADIKAVCEDVSDNNTSVSVDFGGVLIDDGS